MGRPPCCDQANVKKGAWTPDEDAKMLAYVANYGIGNWTLVPQKAGLNRCGKSCRLRWTNYLRPELKHHDFTPQEEQLILDYHKAIGSRWSLIAKKLSGRTDNDVKNHWNTKLKKKLCKMGIDHITHKPLSQVFTDYGRINNNQLHNNNMIKNMISKSNHDAAAAGSSTMLHTNNNINSFASTSWPSSDQLIISTQHQQSPMISNLINNIGSTTTITTTPTLQKLQEQPLIVQIISCPSPSTTNSSSSSCSFNRPHPHPHPHPHPSPPPFCSSNNVWLPPPPPINKNNNNNLLLPCLSMHNSNDFDHQYQQQQEDVGAGVVEKVNQLDNHNYFDNDPYYYYAPRQLEIFTRHPEVADDDVDQILVGSKDDDQLIIMQQHSVFAANDDNSATNGYDDGNNIGQEVVNSSSSSPNDNSHKISAASSFVEEILDQHTKMRMEFPDFFTQFFNY